MNAATYGKLVTGEIEYTADHVAVTIEAKDIRVGDVTEFNIGHPVKVIEFSTIGKTVRGFYGQANLPVSKQFQGQYSVVFTSASYSGGETFSRMYHPAQLINVKRAS
jgi:hypothetical protein